RTETLLAERCQARFAPWGANPVNIAVATHPLDQAFDELRSVDDDPDAELLVELRRLSTLLHSASFSNLVESFGYRAVSKQLVVPEFLMKESTSSGPLPDRNSPPKLESVEIVAIRNIINKRRTNLQKLAPQEIRIRADAADVACFNLEKHHSFELSLSNSDHVIEIFGRQDALTVLIGVLLVERDETGNVLPGSYQVALPAGQ